MKTFLLIASILSVFGTSPLISFESAEDTQPFQYQGYFQEIVPILHKSVLKDLRHFEICLEGIKTKEGHDFFVKTIIEVIKANPEKYSQNFGSMQELIAEMHGDLLYWEKVSQKSAELKKRENE